MNVIFLTVSRMNDIRSRGIYTDLMRKFRDEGHHVYIVAPVERRYRQITSLKEEAGIHILQVKTLNIKKDWELSVWKSNLRKQYKNLLKIYVLT